MNEQITDQQLNAAGHLTIGGCDAVDLAHQFGTPLVVYDVQQIRQQIRAFKRVFEENNVDEENNVVVVGLLDNSEKEQERFKETIVDSNLIKFVKSEKLVHENDNQNSKDLKTFIRTYEILNVAESNDTNYIYLTIRQFQGEEVQTVKVEKALCPAIEEGKNYEFTLKQKRKPEDNILSIFNNSSIVSIIETDKIGLEQIQDSI